MASAVPRPSFLPADRPWPPRRGGEAPARAAEGFIQITGRLRDRAELRHSPRGGPSLLVFEIDSGAGFPFVVHQVVPAEPNALRAAEVKANALGRGDLVHVYAHGAVPRTDHGIAALALLDVIDVVLARQEA